jgi:acyl-CoA-binding protein
MEQEFKKALAYVKSLPPKSSEFSLTNENKLTFYALFKLIESGPCVSPAPSKLKVVEHFKWQAYKKLGDMTKEEAMKKYVAEIDKLNPKWREHKATL